MGHPSGWPFFRGRYAVVGSQESAFGIDARAGGAPTQWHSVRPWISTMGGIGPAIICRSKSPTNALRHLWVASVDEPRCEPTNW